jgi:hypothetical protein
VYHERLHNTMLYDRYTKTSFVPGNRRYIKS